MRPGRPPVGSCQYLNTPPRRLQRWPESVRPSSSFQLPLRTRSPGRGFGPSRGRGTRSRHLWKRETGRQERQACSSGVCHVHGRLQGGPQGRGLWPRVPGLSGLGTPLFLILIPTGSVSGVSKTWSTVATGRSPGRRPLAPAASATTPDFLSSSR